MIRSLRPTDKLYQKADTDARSVFGDDQRDINLFLSGVDYLYKLLQKNNIYIRYDGKRMERK